MGGGTPLWKTVSGVGAGVGIGSLGFGKAACFRPAIMPVVGGLLSGGLNSAMITW